MSLTRTQISLTEAQKRFLERRARQQKRSLADVLRSLVDKEMAASVPSEDPIFDLVGMVDSGGRVDSTSLDRHLYRKDW